MGPNYLRARESGNVCFQNYLRDYEGPVNLVAVVDPGLRLNLLLHIGGLVTIAFMVVDLSAVSVVWNFILPAPRSHTVAART